MLCTVLLTVFFMLSTHVSPGISNKRVNDGRNVHKTGHLCINVGATRQASKV